MTMKLGVNIDHVATLRQARRAIEPNPIEAAIACENAGCDSIVAHLREDRRHINDRDVMRLRKTVKTKFNLEMSIAKDIVETAIQIRPHQATLVPEKRQEITTEGGLDVVGGFYEIKKAVNLLMKSGIETSLFIDPDKEQIKASEQTGCIFIELHTGEYANSKDEKTIKYELERLKSAVKFAKDIGLRVNAGHGLNYKNVKQIAAIEGIEELNIGHSIISRAIFVGLSQAVKEMITLIK